MFNVKIIGYDNNNFVFKNQYTKTSLVEYLFENFYHKCHLGNNDYYNNIHNKLLKSNDVTLFDEIKKTKHCWKIPILTKGGKRKLIKCYFNEV